jgi:hypothetical protein
LRIVPSLEDVAIRELIWLNSNCDRMARQKNSALQLIVQLSISTSFIDLLQ